MKLPVDTSSIAFLCALEPQPVLAFDTKQPRADENGEPLYVVQLIALGEGLVAPGNAGDPPGRVVGSALGRRGSDNWARRDPPDAGDGRWQTCHG